MVKEVPCYIASPCHYLQSHYQNEAACDEGSGRLLHLLCTKQDSVQGRPIPEQEQFAWHIDLLHWHVVSSSRLLGVGSLVIRTSFNILPSRCQPLPCGGGCRVMPIFTVVNHVNLARCTLEPCAYTGRNLQ